MEAQNAACPSSWAICSVLEVGRVHQPELSRQQYHIICKALQSLYEHVSASKAY